MFRLQHTEYLIVLAAIPLMILLYFFVIFWKRRTVKKIGDAGLVKEMTKSFSPQKFALKFLLVVLAFGLTVFALVNPRSSKGMEKVNRSGVDIMIALDVSKSMLAQDIKPTRLERAKQAISKLIDKLGNDRIGLVVFAGKAYLQMPLTADHAAAKMYLSSASPDVVPTQGTVISDALRLCDASFNSKEKKYKAVILISDGEDHDEGAMTIAGQMAEQGIIINTLGVGSPLGTTIMDETTNEPKKDNAGNLVITKLNEEELMRVAEKGNGEYQLFSTTDEVVSKLDAQLKGMDRRTITEDSLVNYKNYFPYFLAAALILLLIEMFVSERRSITERRLASGWSKPGIGVLCFLLLSPVLSFSQNEKALIKKGNEAYEKQEFENAISNYQKASEKNPANPTAQFNLGNALYKNKKTEEAVKAYENTLANFSSKEDKAKAFYNKGVVLQNNKKLPECIEAYKNALKLNPADEDARQNLQKALLQQQQEQKKQDKKEEQKKPKDEKKKKEEQKPKEEEKKEPKQQPSKLTKQDAEEKLKALLQQEKNLQDKLRKVNTASPNKPLKDW
jgi:tetratricopeptide (TPR) repeat protein